MGLTFKFSDLQSVKVSSILIVCLFVMIIYSPISLHAQVCEGDVYLTSQAEVDNFNCSRITGNLTISGDITNLEGLSSLTFINNGLQIEDNSLLTSLDGLKSLTWVGGWFRIVRNPLLTNVNGLSGLEFVYEFEIYDNFSLNNLNGLSRLRTVAADLEIGRNYSLTQCCGLFTFISVGDYCVGCVSMGDNGTGCNSEQEILEAGPCLSIRCSSHPAPFNGYDSECNGASFGWVEFPEGVWVYVWPEENISSVDFFISNSSEQNRNERYAPWEALGGERLTGGDYQIKAIVNTNQGSFQREAKFNLQFENHGLLCSPHPAPFDGRDSACNNGIFGRDEYPEGVWAYFSMPGHQYGIDFATESNKGFNFKYTDYSEPFELLGGEPFTVEGDYSVYIHRHDDRPPDFASFSIIGGGQTTEYELRCSQHRAPFDGTDPLCNGESFNPGVYPYLWPQGGINSAQFTTQCDEFYQEQRENCAPWEALGGKPINSVGDCAINMSVNKSGGGTIDIMANFNIDEGEPAPKPYELHCSPHKAPFDGTDALCDGQSFNPGVYVYVWPEKGINSVKEFSTQCDGFSHWQNENYAPWEALGGKLIAATGDCTVGATVYKSGGETVDLAANFEINDEKTYELRCSQHRAPFDGSDPLCDGKSFNPGVYMYVWPQGGLYSAWFNTQCNGFNHMQNEECEPWEPLGGNPITTTGDCTVNATLHLFEVDENGKFIPVYLTTNFEIDGGAAP